MGVFDNIKGIFGSKAEVYHDTSQSLVTAQENLKKAHDLLSNFLQDIRSFIPAKRHELLYNENIKGKITLIRAWLGKSIYYLDAKVNHSNAYVDGIKNAEHLANMINIWTEVIKKEERLKENIDFKELYTTYANQQEKISVDEEKIPEDVLGLLRIELWGESRAKRGFPVPDNKQTLLKYLEDAVLQLKEAKQNLETHSFSSL